MGDQFRPIITAYGSLSNRKNKVLVPLKPQRTLNNQDLTQGPNPVIVTVPDSESSSGGHKSVLKTITARKHSVETLDDGIITLSPDFVPFTLPDELSQKTVDNVLAVVTLDESPAPRTDSKKEKCHEIIPIELEDKSELEILPIDLEDKSEPEILPIELEDKSEPEILPIDLEDGKNKSQPEVIALDLDKIKEQKIQSELLKVEEPPKEPDPLEVVITLEDSDSLPSLMDAPTSNSSYPIDDLMEQVQRLIERHESNTKDRARVLAKVNSRLDRAAPAYVRGREFETLVQGCVREMEKSEKSLYAQLKKILDKLKASSETPTQPTPSTSSSSLSSATPLEPIPSTSASSSNTAGPSSCSVPGTSASSAPVERRVIKPIKLNTEVLKHYDKQNYEKALELFEQLISIIEDNVLDKEICEKLVEKLRTRLEKAEKKYLYSRVFVETLVFSINGTLSDQNKIYGFIRKTSDELKANMQVREEEELEEDQLDEGLDEKTRLKIRKLEKSLRKIDKIILKLDSEVLFWGEDEDEENSPYIKADKYKIRYIQILNKIGELRKRRVRLGRPTHAKIRFSGTDHPDINRTIEKFYNSTREFPDYGDMLSLVQKVSETKRLGLSAAAVQLVAEKAFTSLGEILKQRRIEDDYDIFLSRLGTEEDPADQDEELARKLEENKKLRKNVDEVINNFVILQEEKKKSGEPEEEEEDEGGDKEEDEDNDEEDKEKESSDRDNDSDGDLNESDDYKENQGSSDDESDSDKNPKEKTSSHVVRKKVVDSLLAKFDLSPCIVCLEDCVELYHNSPDKETSFFKYLKLAKLDEESRNTDENLDEDMDQDEVGRDENMDVDEISDSEDVDGEEKLCKEKKRIHAESRKRSSKDGVESKQKSSKDSTEDTKQRSSKDSTEDTKQNSSKTPDVRRKLEFDSELSQKTLEEDQNSIVTSTTDPESQEKLLSEDMSEDTFADKSSDSIPCVTSSVDNNESIVDDCGTKTNAKSFKDSRTVVDNCGMKNNLKADDSDSVLDENTTEGSIGNVGETEESKGDDIKFGDCIMNDSTTVNRSKPSENNSNTKVNESETNKKSNSTSKDLENVDKTETAHGFNSDNVIRDASEPLEADFDNRIPEEIGEVDNSPESDKEVDNSPESDKEVDNSPDSDKEVDNSSESEKELDNSPDSIEDTNAPTGDNDTPHVEDFIDKETLKLQLEDGEDVDKIFDCLRHCQVEVVPANISAFVDPGLSEVLDDNGEDNDGEVDTLSEDKTQDTNEREDQTDHDSERETKTEKYKTVKNKTKKHSNKSNESENKNEDVEHKRDREKSNENKRKAEKRRLASESETAEDSDEEACGIPSRLKAKLAKSSSKTPNKSKTSDKPKAKPKASSKRKRDSSSSEKEDEEEEEDEEVKSDDSSDEDFNPYEEARAIRSMREQSGKKAQSKRRKTQHGATGSPRYGAPNRATYGATSSLGTSSRSEFNNSSNSRMKYPTAYPTIVPTKAPSVIAHLPGITLTPRAAPANPLPNINLKNITISRSGASDKPSSTTQGFHPRPNMGPASRMGPRSNVGPASKFGPRPMGPTFPNLGPNIRVGPASSKLGPRMGPAGPRSQTGPASARFRSNIGPAGVQRPPMGFRPNVGPASQRSRMGPASTMFRPNAPPPRTISENNMNKTLIKGGVQVQWNKMKASQDGSVNSLLRETNISSKQRVAGSVHSQKIHMKHSVSKDADSGAGQESRVTSNVQRTFTKDGRQIIRKVKKTVTTNVEVEEIMIDGGEVIDLD